MDELNQLLDQLKQSRDRRDQAKAELDNMLALFQASDEWQNFCAVRAFATSEVETLESEIRMHALQLHELCTDLPERVTVKNFKVVEYEPATARNWCFINFRPALRLDEKIFDKAVKDGNIPAEIATLKTEARVQIATKL